MKFLAVLLAAALASSAAGQDVNRLQVSGQANKVLTTGFDTAHVERVFCVWWHDVANDTVSLDSAMVPKIDSADVYHVWYKQCPTMMATAHWHLLDLGAVNYRTPADSETLVKYPSPFGVLVMRRRFGDRIPIYLYYDR